MSQPGLSTSCRSWKPFASTSRLWRGALIVTRGFGVAVVPESIAAKRSADHLIRTPIADAPEWDVHLALTTNPTPAVRAFAAMFVPLADITDLQAELAPA
ncbi:hypothetical protein [Microbacterium amylolyticum]|uniref:DNA-binding transcriptional LysR family regulator n=1 Tax=Microbacterium amylolyticum TaxID=936337 RepID=A0ABS4ZK32_9MICO|nr:hypothetical protein [Microbacterium amylolyticum]MBP2437295.1 DNA-binding transcriptional LysR family regulator [Microbacterium amylolyticum]